MNFLSDITIGQYVPGDSPIHKIDPRIKIVLVLIFMIQIFLNESWTGFGLFMFFFMGVTLLAHLPFYYVLKGLKPIIVLVGITVFFNAFFYRSGAGSYYSFHLFNNFDLNISREGLNTGLIMAARLILLVFSTSLLTLTTSPIQFTDAMEKLLNPFKCIGMPAHELAMMMTISLRFIPVLIEETDRIIKSQRSRGATFGKGNIFTQAKSLLPILVPLFVHAFKHAEDLAAAMESRCYKGGEGRTRLKQLEITGLDAWATCITGVIFAGIALFDVYVHI